MKQFHIMLLVLCTAGITVSAAEKPREAQRAVPVPGDISRIPVNEIVHEERLSEADRPEYRPLDVAGADDPLVIKYRRQYLSSFGRKWLFSALENGEPYRLYIRRRLAERGMPALLEYLPVVESSYTIKAKSKSGAVGMWQFMTNSMKPFLKYSDFVDERLDPWKSTDAALKKLQENYNMFGDWAIAIAAYNCGAGAMAKALKKSPEKDFWYMADHKLLRDQSANYVPKLLAIADIAQNTAFYDIQLPEITDDTGGTADEITAQFDYIPVDTAYSLRRIASELRLDEDTLLTLNPELYRGITPPSGAYELRLPSGLQESAEEVIAGMQPWGFTERHVVRQGDTLWGLAHERNTSVTALCDANGISEKTVLKIGKILYIPPK